MAIYYSGVKVDQPPCQMKTTGFSADITSTSYQSISNSTVAITPGSSSTKMFIILESHGTMQTGSSNGGFQITRTISGGSATEIHEGGAYANPGGIRSLMPLYSTYLDSPNTTSEVTYAVNFQERDGGGLGHDTFGAAGTLTVIEFES